MEKKNFIIVAATAVFVAVVVLVLFITTETPESAQKTMPNNPEYGVQKCDAENCPCKQNTDCDADEFCEFKQGSCGKEAAEGSCSPKPEVCAMDFKPVCGCDGRNYSNKCAAHAKGVVIQGEGTCKIPE